MIISANLKTNHTRESVRKYADELCKFETKHEIRIYPPQTALFKLKSPKNIKFGAQNFYPVKNGSFTGEIGQEQLDEFDIKSVLIGHSERRHVLNENDELITKKFEFAKSQNWEITYCIGEPKSVRQKGNKAVLEYLEAQLKNIDLFYKNLIVAYEPVWAIGTGDVAKVDDVKEILDILRKKTSAPLLYGGSVKAENVKEIYELKNCDGVLVGTASWEVESFKKIIQQA